MLVPVFAYIIMSPPTAVAVVLAADVTLRPETVVLATESVGDV